MLCYYVLLISECDSDKENVSSSLKADSKIVSHKVIDWANNFIFPYMKLDQTTIQDLESGKPLNDMSCKNLVHVLVADVRRLNATPGMSDFRAITKIVDDKYPNAIKDTINEKFSVGKSAGGFTLKLLNRSEHLRKLQSPLVRSGSTKRRRSSSYGCVNWAPETNEDLEKVKTEAASMQVMTEKDKVALMGRLFPLLRREINSGTIPHMSEFRVQWPHFLCGGAILAHFYKLTEIQCYEVCTEQLSLKARELLNLSTLKLPRFASRIEKFMDEYKEHIKAGTKNICYHTIIRIVFAHLGEEIDDFIKVKPVSFLSLFLIVLFDSFN